VERAGAEAFVALFRAVAFVTALFLGPEALAAGAWPVACALFSLAISIARVITFSMCAEPDLAVRLLFQTSGLS
jgi:hypothetical protein